MNGKEKAGEAERSDRDVSCENWIAKEEYHRKNIKSFVCERLKALATSTGCVLKKRKKRKNEAYFVQLKAWLKTKAISNHLFLRAYRGSMFDVGWWFIVNEFCCQQCFLAAIPGVSFIPFLLTHLRKQTGKVALRPICLGPRRSRTYMWWN